MSTQFSSTERCKTKRNYAPEIPLCREIIPEYNFRLKSFENSLTIWTIRTLETLGFMKIASPAAKIYFPRLVNEFYFNLVSIHNGLAFRTTVDNCQFVFNENDIALALGISVSCLRSGIQPCVSESFKTIDKELRIRGKSQFDFIHHAQLPSELWLLDQILYHNVACTSHPFHRNGQFLQALYAARMGKWFSPASLIRLAMIETADLLHKSHPIKKINLFFPFLITRLLLQSGYLPNEQEHQGTTINTFGQEEWNRSHFAIIDKIDRIRQSTKRMHGTPTTPETDEEEYEAFIEEISERGSSQPQPQPLAHQAMDAHMRLSDKIDDLIDLIETIKDNLEPKQCAQIMLEFDHRRNARR